MVPVMSERPAIPADLRRRVLVEAGHRCAIPTCRHIDVEIHHIVDWAKCKTHEYENLIAICPNCHTRAGRGDIDRKSLRIYKANLRFTHDKFSQLEVDVLFEAFGLPSGRAIQWPPIMNVLIRRLLEARYIEVRKHPNGSVSMLGLQQSPDLLVITAKGSEYVKGLGLVEL